MDDVEIENQHEEEGENRGEDHVEVGPEFKSSYLKFANFFYTTTLFWHVEVHQKSSCCIQVCMETGFSIHTAFITTLRPFIGQTDRVGQGLFF